MTMSVLGHYNNFFFAAHLLDIAMGFKTLRTILSSVTHNGKQVISLYSVINLVKNYMPPFKIRFIKRNSYITANHERNQRTIVYLKIWRKCNKLWILLVTLLLPHFLKVPNAFDLKSKFKYTQIFIYLFSIRITPKLAWFQLHDCNTIVCIFCSCKRHKCYPNSVGITPM